MLPCILTTSGVPKMEATNLRLVHKQTAHLWSGKSIFQLNQVTSVLL